MYYTLLLQLFKMTLTLFGVLLLLMMMLAPVLRTVRCMGCSVVVGVTGARAQF